MTLTRRKFNFIVEKTDTGFSVYSAEFPIYSTGSHLSELLANTVEAANLFFEDEGIAIRPHNINLYP